MEGLPILMPLISIKIHLSVYVYFIDFSPLTWILSRYFGFCLIALSMHDGFLLLDLGLMSPI